MIDKLRVRNFRCLRDVEVPLGPLNFLIGPNNTGKSSLLDAVEMLWRCTEALAVGEALRETRFRFDRLVTGGNTGNRIGYDVEFSSGRGSGAPNRATFSFALGSRIGVSWPQVFDQHLDMWCREGPADQGRMCEVHSGDQEGGGADSAGAAERVKYHSGLGLHETILGGYLRGGSPSQRELVEVLHCAPKFRFIPRRIAEPCEIQPAIKLDSDGFGLAACLDLLREEDPKRFEEIQNGLRQFVDTIEMVTFPTAEAGKKTLLFHEKPGGRKIYASEASDGLLLFLAYLTIAYLHLDARVLLFEEPEVGVHPRRLKAIVDVLRAISQGALGSPPVQVIATSHSPYLLDWCSKEEILVFQRSEDDVQVTPLAAVKNIDEHLKDWTPGDLIYTFGEQICESPS